MAFLLAAGIPFGAMAGVATDTDNDTVADNVDNCMTIANGAAGQDQCDTDADGYGNICDPDTTNDGVVGAPDFATFTNNFGGAGHPTVSADTTCDGITGAPDFATFTANFAGAPGPSGLSCAGTIPCP